MSRPVFDGFYTGDFVFLPYSAQHPLTRNAECTFTGSCDPNPYGPIQLWNNPFPSINTTPGGLPHEFPYMEGNFCPAAGYGGRCDPPHKESYMDMPSWNKYWMYYLLVLFVIIIVIVGIVMYARSGTHESTMSYLRG